MTTHPLRSRSRFPRPPTATPSLVSAFRHRKPRPGSPQICVRRARELDSIEQNPGLRRHPGMHKRGMWAAVLAGAMIVEMGAGAARAADDPLLVVVETQPGLGVDAADVRRRIAGELRQRVVSPSDPAAPRASQVLIVSLDEHDIRISMRTGASARVSRTIPDVAERAARLRAVAWLAGNLARDQVGPLLPSLALAPTPKPAAEPAPAAAPTAHRPGDHRAAAGGTAARSAPRPRRRQTRRSRPRSEPREAGVHPRWWITASGGATVSDGCLQVGSRHRGDLWPDGQRGLFVQLRQHLSAGGAAQDLGRGHDRRRRARRGTGQPSRGTRRIDRNAPALGPLVPRGDVGSRDRGRACRCRQHDGRQLLDDRAERRHHGQPASATRALRSRNGLDRHPDQSNLRFPGAR